MAWPLDGSAKFRNAVQVGGSGGITIRKEDDSSPTGYTVRIVHSSNGTVNLVDDIRGRVRATFNVSGGFDSGGDVQAAGDVLARSGSVRAYANGVDSSNVHYWFRNVGGGTRAVIYSAQNGDVYIAPSYGMPGGGQSIRFTGNGAAVIPNGVILSQSNVAILGDANLVSPIYAGTSLYNHLGQLDTPHRLQQVQLASGAVANGTTLNLNDDVWNYESFAGWYAGQSNVYTYVTGLRELSAMPVNTQMYIQHSPNSYVLMAFRDTNTAQRRVLQFINFGANSGFTNFYGFKRVPYRP